MDKICKGYRFLWSGLLGVFLLVTVASAEDTQATKLLKTRNAEFNKEVIQVSESVYTAVGYAVSPVSMTVLTAPPLSAAMARCESGFRQLRKRRRDTNSSPDSTTSRLSVWADSFSLS